MRVWCLAIILGACASARGGAGDPLDSGADSIDAGASDGANVPATDAPISACGTVGVVDVATGPIGSRLPTLVWNGSRYALAFQTDVSPERAQFAFADADGELVPGSIRAVNASGDVGQLTPTIAWSGTEYLVMYTAARNGDDIEVARVGANGEPIAGSVVRLPTMTGDNGWGSVAWDPIDHVWGAEWINLQGYATTARFARLSSTGAKLGEVQANTGTDCCMLNYLNARVVWSGARFAIAWETKGSLHVSEITGAGAVTTPAVFPSDSTAWDPQSVALVSNGAGYAIVYTDRDDATGNFVVHFARTDGGGYIAGSDHVISNPGAFGDNPSVVWTGSEYGVTWSERGGANVNEIWSARLDASGALIDGTRQQLTCGGKSNLWPEIAWDGTRYGIAYEHDVNGPEQAVHMIVGTVAGGGPQ
ncbi:MAG TPA: hypothetical protein VL463_01270 [Kofleriaceae bacterium]|nr:hypothetical protein [Kofleriaceae bacterium]